MIRETDFDVLVIGGGHAGCEAAYASARMGAATILVTGSLDKIATLPCNCSIGGPAKGHLVKEIDALGGAMGFVADQTLTHIRLLNTGKGPAVRALRAQVDVARYPRTMRNLLEVTPNLTLMECLADSLIITADVVEGIRLADGSTVSAKAVIVTTGTFLRGLCHMGETNWKAGRGIPECGTTETPAYSLSRSLREIGFEMGRLKTGTTPRIAKESVDFSRTELQPADHDAPSFSWRTSIRPTELLPSWLTYTNLDTHTVIRENLHRSAMYGGHIEGVGPRYCPSIEDKVVRFADKERHQVFLEQEGWETNLLYVQGMSTSLPAAIQRDFLRSMSGLERCEMVRPGYAVEYDFVQPTELTAALMTKRVSGLFFAGQINGTSGYEEAAAQGLLAGANAALRLRDEPAWTVGRSEGYLGVMVDDLVTKGVTDPYRLLTSRAEFRLTLRQDNADSRMTEMGRKIGLVEHEQWAHFTRKQAAVEMVEQRLRVTMVSGADNWQLAELGIAPVSDRFSLYELLRRGDVTEAKVAVLANLPYADWRDALEQVAISARYDGYIVRENAQVGQAKRQDHVLIPSNLDYHGIPSLSSEAREKFTKVRPVSVAQAARIPGITPADIATLSVYVSAKRRSRTAVY